MEWVAPALRDAIRDAIERGPLLILSGRFRARDSSLAVPSLIGLENRLG